MTRVSVGRAELHRELLDDAGAARTARNGARARWECCARLASQNLNLDLMFGVPGQDEVSLRHDLDRALSLRPDHISYYELEAKPGTRFTHAHGPALERAAEAMEHYYEVVVATLRDAGYRWYETANFCRQGRESQHNLGYWLGHDYLGIGVGAVSTIGLERRRVRPSLPRYLEAWSPGQAPAVRARAPDRVPARAGAADAGACGSTGPVRMESVAGRARSKPPWTGWKRLEWCAAAMASMWLTDRGRHVADEVVVSMVR